MAGEGVETLICFVEGRHFRSGRAIHTLQGGVELEHVRHVVP